MMILPEELVHLEILTQLPGKEVARCKCVCKSWRSAIASRHFSDTYRNRNRCLMLYWSEEVYDLEAREKRFDLRFYYSPLRQLKDDTEDFRQLHQLSVRPYRHYRRDPILTHLVNGLIIVGRADESRMITESRVSERLIFIAINDESVIHLAVHSVCTGESMMLPEVQQYNGTTSYFHLGYDPARQTYKLLRFLFRDHASWPDRRLTRVDIMTLRPSTSVSEWRTLDTEAAGIRCLLQTQDYSIHSAIERDSRRMFSGDGVLCWICQPSPNAEIMEEGIIVFDLNSEKFRLVKFPRKLGNARVVRAQFNKQKLTLSIWEGSLDISNCLLMKEDEEGETWSERCLSLPEELGQPAADKGFVSGSFSGDGGIMVVSAKSAAVYGGTSEMDEMHWVGKIPAEVVTSPRAWHGLDRWNRHSLTFGGRLSCLLDSCHLYRSLDQVLSATFSH